MTELLEIREWLSVSETTEYLSTYLYQTPDLVSVDNLAPLIEEGLLPVYWRCFSEEMWITINRPWTPFAKPTKYLSPEQLLDGYSGEWIKGYFLLDLELMDFEPSFASVFLDVQMFGRHQNQKFGGYAIAARSYANPADLLAQVEFSEPPSINSTGEQKYRELSFKFCDVRDVLKNVFFRKSDIKVLLEKIERSKTPSRDEIDNNIKLPEKEYSSIAPLMVIANEIWEKHYRHLGKNDTQPTKAYLTAWILNEYPNLSTNQAESLYNVTRKYPPSF